MNNQTSTADFGSTTTPGGTGGINPAITRALDWAGHAAKYAGIRGAVVSKGLRTASEYLKTNDMRDAPAAIVQAARRHPVKAGLAALAGLYVIRRVLR